MSSCVSVPTETQFATQVVTSNSLSTSFSLSVSTAPPSVVTRTSTICLVTPSPTGPCTSTSLSTTVITTPGSTSTVSVPVVFTVPVTQTATNPTRTLFSTSCTQNASPDTPVPSPTVAPTTSIPTTFTSASSLTLSDGSISITNIVFTSSLPLTSVYVTATSPAFNSDRNGRSPSKKASIIGGAVGGGLGLLTLIGIIWYLLRRSKRWKDEFDQESDEKEQRARMTLDGEDVQPRPYHYGLVGHSATPTPPGSPPLGATDRRGHSPSNSLSLINPAVRVHSRASSTLDASSGTMSRSRSDLAVTPTSHTRPNPSNASSTAASTVPLLERPVNPLRPHSSGSAIQPTGSRTDVSMHTGPRPHSASGSLPSGAAAAVIPGAASTNWPSPGNEKRRLRGLPTGAAAPIPAAPPVPSLPTAEDSASRSAAPALTPRSPRRPRSGGKSGVLVHVDQGPLPPGSSSRDNDLPPVYSPT